MGNYTCEMCHQENYRENSTGRPSKVCPECYVLYRRATKLYAGARHRAILKDQIFELDIKWIYDKLKGGVCLKTGQNSNLIFEQETITNDIPSARQLIKLIHQRDTHPVIVKLFVGGIMLQNSNLQMTRS